ncbi:DNA primase [Alcaligenes faecalis]|uniref:DUF7146 domain-containing protein n=1 Tax=Alcaligenes faecalis TaxID=511 RepID=UPI000F685113|nr:toprim domain-containing protein [Alcaligenes faecalis]RSE57577.1 DNA primase [Alcaligenes faecalis]
MSYYYKADEVRAQAEGNWLVILSHLAKQLEPALRRPGKHVLCPIHGSNKRNGGGDGFRLFKDAHRTGGGICNTCGPKHDGFELLKWVNGWDFRHCLKAVGDAIGAPRYERHQPKATLQHQSEAQTANEQAIQRARRFRAKGVIVDAGSAPYRHDPENEESYFVMVRNSSGNEKVVWGVDLSRAMHDAGATIGSDVTLYSLGRKLVTVEQKVRNASGDVVDMKEISAHRTEWLVVNASAAAKTDTNEFAQVSVSNGAAVPNRNVLPGPAFRRDKEDDGECFEKEAQPTNVIPMRGMAPAWLQEVTARMEQQEQKRKQYSAKASERHHRTWDECLPITSEGTRPLYDYLSLRQIHWLIDRVSETDSMRFHPALPYYHEEESGEGYKVLGKFPAMVAAVRDLEGNILTLHRTYLTPRGDKAKVPEVKKMSVVGNDVDINGSSIRLGEPVNGILGVAEGIETALSAFWATGIPTWSTINAQLMKSFKVPEGVETVIIWADKDKSRTGEVAANVLKSRLEAQGILVLVMLPPAPIPAKSKSIDWNDVLLEQGRAGFPSRSYILRYCDVNRARAFAKVEYSSALA